MELKVRQDTYNPLLKRKEVHVEVDHDRGGTPSRTDLRKAIADKYQTKPENVYVLEVETKTGTQTASCQVEVYDDALTAQKVVAKHIKIRNLPLEERKLVRELEAKKEEAKPKTEKPKAEAAKGEKTEKPKPEVKEEKPKSETKQPPEQPKKGKEVEAK